MSEFPYGAAAAVSLTFDVDAETGWLGEGPEYARRLTILSEGRYGVTRGIPRILELLGRHSIPATFFVPGHTAELHPHMIDELLTAGHEVAHHGHMHVRSDHVTPQLQAEEIDRGLAALTGLGAPRPTGYRSTSWELTPETFDLLIDRGFDYDSSCMGDDRPYLESHDGRSILELPVHWSLDDWPRFAWNIDSGGNASDAAELFRCWSAEFDSARADKRHTSFTMHPEVIGRAYRLVQLEKFIEYMVSTGDVWFARLDEVAALVGPAVRSTGLTNVTAPPSRGSL